MALVNDISTNQGRTRLTELDHPELAEKVGVDRNTIAQIEAGRYASDETLAVIRRVLEAAGVEFTKGWPVRFRPERMRP